MISKDKVSTTIDQSSYISRDLSWLKFNLRVLDQAKNEKRTIFEQLKFLAITASNLDEFFMIRVGSLYNYIDYSKERVDYSGLREIPFKNKLLAEAKDFVEEQSTYFRQRLVPRFKENEFRIVTIRDLRAVEKQRVENYFIKTVFPMLTPMIFDSYHTFPVLMNKLLILGVVTQSMHAEKEEKRLSFVQIPPNLPRFYEIEREEEILFIPIERIIKWQIDKLYRNVKIVSVDTFRITRNEDFTLAESDDVEADFIYELKRKIKTRKTGRVVRIEVESASCSEWMMSILKRKWKIEDDNIFFVNNLLDFTSLWQIINHTEFRDKIPSAPPPVQPVSLINPESADLFEYLKHRDVLLHHPYNSIAPVINLLEKAAEDPNVLAIKLTIYRLAKDSRIISALLKAAENGKHVSALFELKARFDEENNIREAQKLQKAGCFVIYGIGSYKTHTKLLLIVRKEGDTIRRYVHMSSGNYNEQTSRLYTDIGLLSTNEIYAQDISEFFNVITGHSNPSNYQYLLTAPRDMRHQLLTLIEQEAENARRGLPSGIVIKINSLEDKEVIDQLYKASQAGVPIKLIIRGICCIRPHRKGLSENIDVRSLVGNFLEHTRLYYFHNNNEPKIYGGSADVMVRSFDRRIESLFLIVDKFLKKQVINILAYNLKDNVNSYIMQEDGSYIKRTLAKDEEEFNVHLEFFYVNEQIIENAKLF